MNGMWRKKRNELLAITACACTFGAIMLEVGIHAAQRDLLAVNTDSRSLQIEPMLKSVKRGDDIDTGQLDVLTSSENDPLLSPADYEFRKSVRQVLGLREVLTMKLREDRAPTSDCEAADQELRTATLQLQMYRDVLAKQIITEQEAPVEESKDAISTNMGDSR